MLTVVSTPSPRADGLPLALWHQTKATEGFWRKSRCTQVCCNHPAQRTLHPPAVASSRVTPRVPSFLHMVRSTQHASERTVSHYPAAHSSKPHHTQEGTCMPLPMTALLKGRRWNSDFTPQGYTRGARGAGRCGPATVWTVQEAQGYSWQCFQADSFMCSFIQHVFWVADNTTNGRSQS